MNCNRKPMMRKHSPRRPRRSYRSALRAAAWSVPNAAEVEAQADGITVLHEEPQRLHRITTARSCCRSLSGSTRRPIIGYLLNCFAKARSSASSAGRPIRGPACATL